MGHYYCGKWTFYQGEIVLVCVTGISPGKFPVLNINGYIQKNKESAQDFNVLISKGVLLPMVRQPITKLQLTRNLVYHQGPN